MARGYWRSTGSSRRRPARGNRPDLECRFTAVASRSLPWPRRPPNAGLGLPLAWLLRQTPLPGARRLVDVLVTLPLVLLPTVTGYYLIVLLGRRVFVRRPALRLDPAGRSPSPGSRPWWPPPSWPSRCSSAQRGPPSSPSIPALERAARTLGRSAWRVALEVTMPLARKGVPRGAGPGLRAGLGRVRGHPDAGREHPR